MINNLIVIKGRLNKYFSFLPENKRVSIYMLYRKLTSPLRTIPSFIIIGAARSGTTSLYQYLIQHPLIFPAVKKELHFFDDKHIKEPFTSYISSKKNLKPRINNYRANFPFSFIKYFYKYILRRKFITGEATPRYLYYPQAPKRVFYMLPKVKLIILLRNPVDRIHSIYNFRIKKGNNLQFKTLTLEEILKRGDKILRMRSKMKNRFQNLMLQKGIYLHHIKNWLRYFPKEQILIIRSEDFFEKPPKIMKEVFKFLDLPVFRFKEYKQYNMGGYTKMKQETRRWLINYYKPYNYQLYKFLDRNFEWEK